MRIISKAIVILYLTIVYSLAQDPTRISDPELDFVKNSFLFTSTTQKKEIIRKEVDITGEGQMAVFLRASVGGGKCGEYWTAYIKIDGDFYQRYEDIEFREDTFRAGKVPNFNPKGGILAYYPGKGGGDLIQISFEENVANTKKLRNLSASKIEDQNLFREIFGRRFEEGPSEDFFKNPPHKVIAVADILARPQASNSQQEAPKRAVSGSEISEPVIKPKPAYKTSEISQVSARTVGTPLTSWALVVAAIVTAIVTATLLLWLLRKKYVGGRTK